jgi:hypothetical protein
LNQKYINAKIDDRLPPKYNKKKFFYSRHRACGLGHMGPNEDVRDLSGGDCDALNSDKYVCILSPTLGIYWVELGFINNCKEPQL